MTAVDHGFPQQEVPTSSVVDHISLHAAISSCFFSLSYQVVVWFNAEEISEVAEGHRGVGLEAEVGVVVRWCQVAPLAGTRQEIKTKGKMIYEVLFLHECFYVTLVKRIERKQPPWSVLAGGGGSHRFVPIPLLRLPVTVPSVPLWYTDPWEPVFAWRPELTLVSCS